MRCLMAAPLNLATCRSETLLHGRFDNPNRGAAPTPQRGHAIRSDALSGASRARSETDGLVDRRPFRPFALPEDRAMDFRPLAEAERRQLITALRGHADRGVALLIDAKDTSYSGTADDVPDEQVVVAVKSVPCHY